MSNNNLHMIDETEERLKKIYYIAVKTRNFEITQLVQRNNFFMIFQGVLLACVIYSSNTVPFVHLMICLAGLYIAYSQTKVAAGAKFWQEYWETEVVKAESNLHHFYKNKYQNMKHESLTFIPLFTKTQSEVYQQVALQLYEDSKKKSMDIIKNVRFNIFSTRNLILSKPSVSKIPINVGQCLTIIWFFLALSTISPLNQLLELHFVNQYLIRGFPTHQSASQQESSFSEKSTPISLANKKIKENGDIIKSSTPSEFNVKVIPPFLIESESRKTKALIIV